MITRINSRKIKWCGVIQDVRMVFRGSWRKLQESPGKIAVSNREMLRILGLRAPRKAGSLGLTLPGPCPHLPCRVFREIDSPAFSSFPDNTRPAFGARSENNGKTAQSTGPKLNTNFFFIKLFGRSRDIPAKSRDIPPKRFCFPGFEGHTELFGPHPFTWKTPTPPENIRTQKFGFGFLFRACTKTSQHSNATARRRTEQTWCEHISWRKGCCLMATSRRCSGSTP